MSETPYARFNGKDLILRDELALDRTLLANERTLLSYLRTALSLLVAGGSILHYAPAGSWFHLLGVACLPVGLSAGVVGSFRFWRMQRGIIALRKRSKSG
jgi:putative membrane protein